LRPKYYRKSSKDELETIREVYDDLVYKPGWFSHKPNSIKTVIDIGALIGSFTLWAHEQWPKAIIHSFEPDPESFELLKKNVATARAQKQVKMYNEAVWKNEKILKLHRFKNTSGSNSVVFLERPFVGKHEDSVEVKSQSFSKFLKKIHKPIDFLKIDCEGSEYDILYSLSKLELKKIRQIVIEYHEFENNSKHKGNALSDFLRKNGFVSQIIPTNIRAGHGLGYIYASNVKQEKRLIEVFDEQSRLVIKLRKLADKREDYAKDLKNTLKKKDSNLEEIQKLADEREIYGKELENTLKKKDSNLEEIQKLADEREIYGMDLEKTLKKKDSILVELQKLADDREIYGRELEDTLKKKESDLSELSHLTEKRQNNITNLEKTIQKINSEISIINQDLQKKNNELMHLKFELDDIQNSIMFKFMKNISRKIDSTFPNNTNRGELKKVVQGSLELINKEGYRNYFSAVKIKVHRGEFKMISPIQSLDYDQSSQKKEKILLNNVHKNRKKRLKIKQMDKNEIKKDQFVIEDDLM